MCEFYFQSYFLTCKADRKKALFDKLGFDKSDLEPSASHTLDTLVNMSMKLQLSEFSVPRLEIYLVFLCKPLILRWPVINTLSYAVHLFK